MGLDMYLSKKTYIWSDERGDVKISGLKSRIDPKKVKYIVEEAGYWRKANAIHKWIVDNVQDGEDDCKEYYFDIDSMKELLELCNKVIKASKLVPAKIQNGYTWNDKDERVPIIEDGKIIKDPTVANEHLPTESGFFFGNTDYNEWYLEDIKLTKKILEACIKDANAEYTYQSSW